jgi:hypothetical protein
MAGIWMTGAQAMRVSIAEMCASRQPSSLGCADQGHQPYGRNAICRSLLGQLYGRIDCFGASDALSQWRLSGASGSVAGAAAPACHS